jgi:hypothetical protein
MSPEQIAGVAADPLTNMIYLAYRGRLAAFDLASDKWSGCRPMTASAASGRRSPATARTLVVGSDLQDYWYVIDARTGKLRGTIKAPNSMNAHNLNLSPDARRPSCPPNGPVMAVGDVDSMKLVKEIRFGDNVRPFVVNKDGSLIYANTNNLLGFEVADVKTGKVVKHVEVNTFPWRDTLAKNIKIPHGCPSHGIALVNDEKEVWIVGRNQQLRPRVRQHQADRRCLWRASRRTKAPHG